MNFKVHTGISGRFRFYVLDEFGNIERGRGGVPVCRDASGFLRAIGHEQKNLITDQGLEALNDTGVNSLRTWLKVATGTDAPEVTDQAVTGLIDTTFSEGGFAKVTDRTAENDKLNMSFQITKIWENDTGSGANIGSFGLGRDNTSAADILARLESAEGTSVTVSVPDGKKFRLDHTLEQSIDFVRDLAFTAKKFNVAGQEVDSISYTGKLYATVSSSSFMGALSPNGTNLGVIANSGRIIPGDALSSPSFRTNQIFIATTTPQKLPYIPGSLTNQVKFTIPESSANGENIVSVGLGSVISRSIYGGYTIVFDEGQSVTKTADETVEMLLTKTWGRV